MSRLHRVFTHAALVVVLFASYASAILNPWNESEALLLNNAPKVCTIINQTPFPLKRVETFWYTGKWVPGGEPDEFIPPHRWAAYACSWKEWFQGMVGGVAYEVLAPGVQNLTVSIAFSQPVAGRDKVGARWNTSIWTAYEGASADPHTEIGPQVLITRDEQDVPIEPYNETLISWTSGDSYSWCRTVVGFQAKPERWGRPAEAD